MSTALFVVDAQRNMLEGADSVPDPVAVAATISGLLETARSSGSVIVFVQNDGPPGEVDAPGSPGWELFFPAGDGEIVVRKDQSDAFGSNAWLARTLQGLGVERIVISGMQSEFCIEATSLGAVREGFSVLLPRGAHATFDDGTTKASEVADSVERSLSEAGVEIVSLSEVSFG
jgi:streptothricin hydrolase